METNNEVYTVEFFNEQGYKYSFEAICEMLSNKQMRISILDFKSADLNSFMEQYRPCSDSVNSVITTNLQKDVYLTDKNGKLTILYSCTLSSIYFDDVYSNDIEKITFEISYQQMRGEIIRYIPPSKLNIEIGNLTEEQASKIIKMFDDWKTIVKNDDSRWTSFYVPKDFKADIKILSK